MRAVVCPRAPIAPKDLVYESNYPTPSPKQGHVLIRVRAYGLNRSEIFTRQGHSPSVSFPRVLGIECVGEVVDAGGGSWKEGDAVAAIMGGMGRQFDGGYAELTLVPHACVSPSINLPSRMSWTDFAAIPETYLTAYGTLNALALKADDTLLVRGGTTSLGLATISLAGSPLFSCRNVIATTRSQSKAAIPREYGANYTVVDTGTIAAQIKGLTAQKGVDKCIELVGGPTLTDSCLALGPDGVVSMVGCVSGEWVCKDFDPMGSLAPNKRLTTFVSEVIDMAGAPLQSIVDAVDCGQLLARIDRIFPMQETGDAHAYMEANKAAGKVVCVVDEN